MKLEKEHTRYSALNIIVPSSHLLYKHTDLNCIPFNVCQAVDPDVEIAFINLCVFLLFQGYIFVALDEGYYLCLSTFKDFND